MSLGHITYTDHIKQMNLTKAITLYLGGLNQPVITAYELGLLIFNLYVSKKYLGETITNIRKDYPSSEIYRGRTKSLLSLGILSQNKNFSENKVFNTLGRKNLNPQEIICSVDPFCYVSHLSAMEWHGLTNRFSKTIFITTPSPKDWSAFAKQQMQKDLGDSLHLYIDSGFPQLQKMNCLKIDGLNLNKYSSRHLGAFKSIKGSSLRVSTIGRTFLDMVNDPKLCGGIRHVVDIYQNFGQQYSTLIINESEQHANLIEKTRIGYLLDELCNVKNDVLDKWAKNVKRGGSRKLDPNAEYSSQYSEKWCLSLNIE